MSDGLTALLERAMPIDTSAGPGPVMATLAAIEDEFAQAQNEHARLAGWVKRRSKFMETFLATLVEVAEGDNITERKEKAKAMLHDTEEWSEYLEQLEQLETLSKQFDYLDARKSIGQSILKAEGQAGEPKFGEGARPAG